MVTEIANAKINLFLDVVGIRDDGFHNIKSVMHTVSLADRLTIDVIPSDEALVELSHNSSELQNDEDNLVCKSAVKYLSKYDIKSRVNITLEKNIPVGAGLGGGSADAAATLRGLNRIFCCADEKELLILSAEVGSDVPFCLAGGTALCEGRGEILSPLDFNHRLHLVIAIGDSRVSTPAAYKALDEKFEFDFSNRNRRMPHGVLYNIFEEVINPPEISKIKEYMIKNGAEQTLMSGSGPSVFGIYNTEGAARFAVSALQKLGFDAYYATSQPSERVK